MQAIADRVQWHENARSGSRLETGEAAKEAITTLGCDACRLSGVCIVKGLLEDKVEKGHTESELARHATMLDSAPQWLAAARLSRSGADPAQLYAATQSVESTKRALATGTLNLEDLLAGVTNETEGLATKADFPELNEFAGVDPDKKIEMQRLAAENGNVFLVADASDAVGFKGEPLGAAEYGILTGKLLERMLQPGGDGRTPQVLSPDNTMQKVLTTTGNGHLDEIRMSGKNRLYATVAPLNDGTVRIIILGNHGGDASTQRAFLKKLGI